MPYQVSTILVDYQLNSLPTDEELINGVIKPFTALTKTEFVQVENRTTRGNRRTLAFESVQTEEHDIFILIRLYDRQLKNERVLLTITAEVPNHFEDIIEKSEGLDLEDTIKGALDDNFGEDAEGTHYPVIRRAIPDPPYMRTCDDRLIEYGFEKVLFSKHSEYQHIQIVDTIDFGRLLILDDQTNLAENDTQAYTHTLMNIPQENYKDKQVLILGGGDGALMNELQKLESGPAFVTMVDIDVCVMDACSQYMRSVCGPYLDRDNREGPRHKLIVGDAVKFLKDCIAEGRKFDYVFGDLTDCPVSTSPRDDSVWEFLRTIITMGTQVLAPGGKYLTHSNGKSLQEPIDAYENMLTTINDGKVKFRRWENFVPSFMETWLFYELTRKD